jgi:hypothetical protein
MRNLYICIKTLEAPTCFDLSEIIIKESVHQIILYKT